MNRGDMPACRISRLGAQDRGGELKTQLLAPVTGLDVLVGVSGFLACFSFDSQSAVGGQEVQEVCACLESLFEGGGGGEQVVASLAAAAVLLAAFVVTEWRDRHALLPLRLLANRSRSGAYLIMLCLATAMFGFFFFLTIFLQEVLGYSPLRTGLADLPFAVMIVVMSGIVSRLVSRTGARPLMLAGAAVAAGGVYWFSLISEHSTYLNGLLGPMLVTSTGLGLLFVPLSLVALNQVAGPDSGVAASLLNTGQQVGGAIGLAALGTVTWTEFARNLKHHLAQAAGTGHHVAVPKAGGTLSAAALHPALAAGISRGFEVAAAIAVLALLVTIVMIRVRRDDLTGTQGAPTASPATDRAAPQTQEAPEPVIYLD